MRRILITLVICFAATAASAATLTETIDKTFDVRPGSAVVLSNVNGRITISSWDQPRVRVIARKEVKGSHGELEANLRALRVEMQPGNGGLVITTHHPRRDGSSSVFGWLLGKDVQAQVQYELTIPRTMNLDVQNTNGSIEVRNVNGKLEAATTNGKIALIACAGSIEASTTNGSIRAELTRVASGQPLRFETTNGRIELTVPQTLAANIDASTTNGSIDTDLPVSTTRISRNSLRGTVNGGGPSIRMRTTNGGIGIRTSGAS